MPEAFNSLPYNLKSYDNHFITKQAVLEIIDFCKENARIIEAFFAKWSLAHWCIIRWSDIDHVRIKIRERIDLTEKIKLVDEIESRLQKLWIAGLRRIREDDYIRVFHDWAELDNFPLAKTKDHEIYPTTRLIIWKNVQDYFENVIRVWTSYVKTADEAPWVWKMRERILTNLTDEI
ncbi:MAG: hypothetical protein ACD_2C00153G0006 [uncultured bacterium (gcode 4)]|uniref:Uncharacterized protein n=1 Tax=uncultured bacterium (gcode 4) TaxID=1234023 RepID=K2H115_9BACT|nr:MAG: hypothetical protein ACD_2C00153G0006 [uncultured bacterium (gcode 4)]